MVDVQQFFILSNPRSGSSLLRIICDSHQQLSVPPESGFMEWWYQKYKNWNVSDSKNSDRIIQFCSDLESSKKFETWNFDIHLFKDLISTELPSSYSQLLTLVYTSFGLQQGKNIVACGDKNNYYIKKTKLIHDVFPKAKFLHMVRDGRDVATSYKALKNLESTSKYIPKLPNNITEIANEWQENNQILTSFFKTLPAHQVLTVRYEDLILKLEEECKKITNFLNVPFDKNMLNYYNINKALNLEPKETLDWKKKTLEKPDVSNIGKYKELLSKEEITLFNSIAKQTLNQFNYEC
jgi:hypothetical protein